MKSLKFSFAIAASSTESSPCSNVPIPCLLCPKSAPAVFKYNWKAHFANAHPNAVYANYALTANLTNFELKSVKGIWNNRGKIPTKRVMKRNSAIPLEVSTAHISGGALGLTAVPAAGKQEYEIEVSEDMEDESQGRDSNSDDDSEPGWDADERVNKGNEADYYELTNSKLEDNRDGKDVGEEAEGDEDLNASSVNDTHVQAPPQLDQLATDTNDAHISHSNHNIEEGHVETGRSKRKRKVPATLGLLSQCLCGENAIGHDAVVMCNNRGCETRVSWHLAAGHARHVRHPQERKHDEADISTSVGYGIS
ncbi:hypothetical protein H0H92_009722 [Tricholoma furcatifolium]|nr:hypothetical protein H0H92_009722 [Tricholoma furcatifolium]